MSLEELAEVYAEPHDHRLYGRGHGERVDATIALALDYFGGAMVSSVADLSCGNGVIAEAIADHRLYLGDFAPGYEYTGPIEQTLDLIPHVSVFVLSETLEHLDDPDAVLARIAEKTETLVLTTPVEAWGDTNTEHYWAWNRGAVEAMMSAAGFAVRAYTQVDSRTYGEPYCYGIWIAERT